VRIESFTLQDALLLIYLFLPSLLGFAALIVLIKKRGIKLVLWLCSIFWIFISVGELIEGKPFNPGLVPILFATMISFSCMVFLLYMNRKNPH
jgi:hypothetical protein